MWRLENGRRSQTTALLCMFTTKTVFVLESGSYWVACSCHLNKKCADVYIDARCMALDLSRRLYHLWLLYDSCCLLSLRDLKHAHAHATQVLIEAAKHVL